MPISRRTWLATTAATVAGTSALSLAPSQSSAHGEFNLGLVTYNLAKAWDLETILSRCEETGFAGVELRTTHAHGVEVELNADQRSEVKARFADSPITCIGLGSAFDYHTPDAQKLRSDIEATKAYIQLCHDVGGSGIKVRPNGFPEGVSKKHTIEQIGRSLRDVGEFGNNLGVAIRLEVHGRGTSSLPYIAQMVEVADHPNVGVCWNSNTNDLSGDGFEVNFDLVKNSINAVHMRDLYDEKYPYRRLFQRLNEIDFNGYCMAEIQASDDPVRVMKYYRGMFLALQNKI